jgi:hypothetical protein
MIHIGCIEEKVYEKQVFKEGLRVISEKGKATERYFAEKSELRQLLSLDSERKIPSVVLTASSQKLICERELLELDGLQQLDSILTCTRHDFLYKQDQVTSVSEGIEEIPEVEITEAPETVLIKETADAATEDTTVKNQAVITTLKDIDENIVIDLTQDDNESTSPNDDDVEQLMTQLTQLQVEDDEEDADGNKEDEIILIDLNNIETLENHDYRGRCEEEEEEEEEEWIIGDEHMKSLKESPKQIVKNVEVENEKSHQVIPLTKDDENADDDDDDDEEEEEEVEAAEGMKLFSKEDLVSEGSFECLEIENVHHQLEENNAEIIVDEEAQNNLYDDEVDHNLLEENASTEKVAEGGEEDCNFEGDGDDDDQACPIQLISMHDIYNQPTSTTINEEENQVASRIRSISRLSSVGNERLKTIAKVKSPALITEFCNFSVFSPQNGFPVHAPIINIPAKIFPVKIDVSHEIQAVNKYDGTEALISQENPDTQQHGTLSMEKENELPNLTGENVDSLLISPKKQLNIVFTPAKSSRKDCFTSGKKVPLSRLKIIGSSKKTHDSFLVAKSTSQQDYINSLATKKLFFESEEF